MRVMFIVADFPNLGKANVHIAYDIKEYLEKKGITVYVYGKYSLKKENKVIELDIISRLFCRIQSSNSFFMKVLRFIYNNFFSKKDAYEKLYQHIVNNIPRIIKENNIDCSIIFVAPHDYLKIPIENKNSAFFLYSLDPYFSHYKNAYKRDDLEKQEELVIGNVRKAFVTELIYNEYIASNILGRFKDKLITVEFPKINEIKFNNTHLEKKYKILFVGNLYKDIRNPLEIIKIFSRLSIKNIELNFFGSYHGFDKNELEIIEKQYDFVKFNSPLSFNDVKNQIDSTNFLLNIGNLLRNQMPSKIIEYINTGKPIINYAQISDCPTLSYTKNYPLAINILSGNIDFDKIENFINEFHDKQIDKNIILNKYKNCTVEYVGEQVYQELHKLGGNDGKV